MSIILIRNHLPRYAPCPWFESLKDNAGNKRISGISRGSMRFAERRSLRWRSHRAKVFFLTCFLPFLVAVSGCRFLLPLLVAV